MARSGSPRISVSRRGSRRGDANCTVVWVSGDHDIATKGSLAVNLACAAQLDEVGLLVDLSGVTFMDASTVGAIVGSRNQLRSRGQSLELRAPSALAFRVLELCGLTDLIQAESVHARGPKGVAPGTWVDIPSIDLRQPHDCRVECVMGPPRRDVPATVGRHVEDACRTVEVARGGP